MSMFEILDELCALCPPPELKSNPMQHHDWMREFVAVGSRLPEQLLQLERRYGDGSFASIDRPVNASFSFHTWGLGKMAIGRLKSLRHQKLHYPRSFSIPLYFEDGGLLPIGVIDGGIDVCFRTEGDNPDRWKISLIREANRKIDHLDLSLLEFIRNFIKLEIQSNTFGRHLPCRKGYQFVRCSFDRKHE